MTQASSSQPLILDLLAMRLPQADLPLLSTMDGNVFNPDSEELLLVPGETSEMLVKLENMGTGPLTVNLEISGDFPLEWCRINTQGNQLTPGERREAVLTFQIPRNFFEGQHIRSGEVLKLDYYGRVDVYGAYPETPPQLLELANFNLYIRPQSLYLDYLPQVYQETDFISRFLAIVEQAFDPDVQTLDNLWAYLDPLTAPKAMLEFLAHWVGWQIQPYLSLDRQRYLIRQAMEIYRWRGTRKGLRLNLHLATGLPLDDHITNENEKHIGIYESFSSGFVLSETHLGQDATLGGVRPFHFNVHLRLEEQHQIEEQLVKTVIEQEKPAFCTYDLYIEYP